MKFIFVIAQFAFITVFVSSTFAMGQKPIEERRGAPGTPRRSSSPLHPKGYVLKVESPFINTCDPNGARQITQEYANWMCYNNRAQRISDWSMGSCETTEFEQCRDHDTNPDKEICEPWYHYRRDAKATFRCL